MSNQPVLWKMRNGKLISVDEMDINHLRNVLKMIISNSEKAQITCPKKDIDHHQFESDLGYNFNDDECRGNQW